MAQPYHLFMLQSNPLFEHNAAVVSRVPKGMYRYIQAYNQLRSACVSITQLSEIILSFAI